MKNTAHCRKRRDDEIFSLGEGGRGRAAASTQGELENGQALVGEIGGGVNQGEPRPSEMNDA